VFDLRGLMGDMALMCCVALLLSADPLPASEAAAPAPGAATAQPAPDPPRRWNGMGMTLLSAVAGGALVALGAAAFALPCSNLCGLRDFVNQVGAGSVIVGGMLFVAGVVMSILIARHNSDVPDGT
jgi:hypothetical protein